LPVVDSGVFQAGQPFGGTLEPVEFPAINDNRVYFRFAQFQDLGELALAVAFVSAGRPESGAGDDGLADHPGPEEPLAFHRPQVVLSHARGGADHYELGRLSHWSTCASRISAAIATPNPPPITATQKYKARSSLNMLRSSFSVIM
jgi:hypothetical protein